MGVLYAHAYGLLYVSLYTEHIYVLTRTIGAFVGALIVGLYALHFRFSPSTRLNDYRYLHYHKIVENEHYVSTFHENGLHIPILSVGLSRRMVPFRLCNHWRPLS